MVNLRVEGLGGLRLILSGVDGVRKMFKFD